MPKCPGCLFFKSPYLSQSEITMMKNNSLDLNDRQELSIFPLLNICLCFFLGQPHYPHRMSLSSVFSFFIQGCNSGHLFINHRESIQESRGVSQSSWIYQTGYFEMCNVQYKNVFYCTYLFLIALKGELDFPCCFFRPHSGLLLGSANHPVKCSSINTALVFKSKNSQALR